MATAVHDLVLLPGHGFMPAHARGTRSNVVLERDGMTFTGAVVPDRDGIRVIFTVRGVQTSEQPGPHGFTMVKANASVSDDHGRLVADRPRWTTGASLRFADVPTLNWTLILERPQADVRSLDLRFDGPAGEWQVELPLEPIDHEGIPSWSIDVGDHKHGVTLAARAVGRSTSGTAVELEAYLDPPSLEEGWARRYVLGIGASMSSGRLCGDQVVLRDEHGTVHFEGGRPIPEETGGKRREVVFFPGLPREVRRGTIEVDVVWVHEGQDTAVSVPVPGDAEIAVAGCRGRVSVTRVPPREGTARSAIHIETRPADVEADRQLVYMAPSENTRVGMTVSHCVGQLPTVEIPETTEQLSSVTFRGGAVQVRGRWRLDIPLETS